MELADQTYVARDLDIFFRTHSYSIFIARKAILCLDVECKAMPPITMQGVVTKVGYMNKTATVTVTRWIMHPRTRKVCGETRLRFVHTLLAHSYAILL